MAAGLDAAEWARRKKDLGELCLALALRSMSPFASAGEPFVYFCCPLDSSLRGFREGLVEFFLD